MENNKNKHKKKRKNKQLEVFMIYLLGKLIQNLHLSLIKNKLRYNKLKLFKMLLKDL